MVLYPVAVSGVGELSIRFNPQPTATRCMELTGFVGFITCFDIPERIRRSKYLSAQAFLVAYLATFLYFVFGFLPVVLKYRVGGRVLIIGVVITVVLWSVLNVIKHSVQAPKDSHTSAQ
jgi:hypothetical protein